MRSINFKQMRYLAFLLVFMVHGKATTIAPPQPQKSTTERVEAKLDKFNENVLNINTMLHQKLNM